MFEISICRAVGAIALTVAAQAAAANWELVDIGALGGRNSYASAVTAGGLVTGCAEAADGGVHAFVHRDDAMQDLGAGCGLAINDQAVVAGRAASGELVVWSSQGSITGLGVQGTVGGINGAGVVVGSRTEGSSTRAFVYRDGALADLADPAIRSEATAINERGDIVGAANGRAFIHDGTLRDLGTLGGNMSVARGLNARAEVVGQSSNELGQPTPFIHREAMQPLPGPAYSSAIAINARGQVVGSGEGVHGYLIDGEALTLLGEIPAVVARGWRKLVPTGINDRGWIVGTGENPEGDLRAFILKPLGAKKPRRVR